MVFFHRKKTLFDVESSIVSAERKYARKSLLIRVFGYPLLFCGCIQVACRLHATLEELSPSYSCKNKFSAVVKLYGGKKRLRSLAGRLRDEQAIFFRSVMGVNLQETSAAQPSPPQLELLELACKINCDFRFLLLPTVDDEATPLSDYALSVWKMSVWKNLGGDYRILMYGFLEHLSDLHGHDSMIVGSFLTKLLSDQAFQHKIMNCVH